MFDAHLCNRADLQTLVETEGNETLAGTLHEERRGTRVREKWSHTVTHTHTKKQKNMGYITRLGHTNGSSV